MRRKSEKRARNIAPSPFLRVKRCLWTGLAVRIPFFCGEISPVLQKQAGKTRQESTRLNSVVSFVKSHAGKVSTLILNFTFKQSTPFSDGKKNVHICNKIFAFSILTRVEGFWKKQLSLLSHIERPERRRPQWWARSRWQGPCRNDLLKSDFNRYCILHAPPSSSIRASFHV